MSERIRGSYDYALYKATYTLLYFTRKTKASPRVNVYCKSGAIPANFSGPMGLGETANTVLPFLTRAFAAKLFFANFPSQNVV